MVYQGFRYRKNLENNYILDVLTCKTTNTNYESLILYVSDVLKSNNDL